MRVKKAIINTIAGGMGTLLVGIFQFIGRFVFIRFLSDEYLGISSLFTNILSLLSLAELGIGTAICFSLYEPLAEANFEKIKAILSFLRKTYFIIGIVIMGVGLSLLPFLPFIIKGNTELVNINVIYILYVLQSATSYWFWGYKSILLQADQKLYLIKAYQVAANVVTITLQLTTLAIFRDFLLYSIIGLMANIFTNVASAHAVDRIYPYMKEKNHYLLTRAEKKKIFKDVFGMSFFKINTTVVNSTDNLMISAFIDIRSVALYGNYQIVISGISQVAMQLFGGVTSTVGNLFVEDSKEKSEFVFRCLQFLSYWIYSFIGIGIIVFINPVIQLFFGKSRLFGESLVLLQVIYFIINGFQRTSFIYRDACGLFWKGKMRPIATVILNIGLSFVLVLKIGLAGVILGTIVSWLLTTWWYDPILIYRNVFQISPLRHFIGYGKATILTLFLGWVTVCLAELVPFDGIFKLLLQFILVLFIPNIGYLLVYCRTEEFKYIKGVFLKRKVL